MSINIEKIQTKWYTYLPKFSLLIWFTSYLILDLLHHAAIISILSSAFWVMTWAIVFTASLKDDSELEITKDSKPQKERDDSYIWYDKFLNQNITEKVTYLAISLLIFSLMFLSIRKYDVDRVNQIENYNYLLFYGSGNILLSLSVSLSYIGSTFDISSEKTQRAIYIIVMLVGLCGAGLMGISASYLPEVY